MYIRQRQEQFKPTSIEGRKIINNITYAKRQVKTLSPQLYEMPRQQTFETDSFKEILTKRSGSHLASKQNISLNQRYLRKVNQEQSNPLKQKKNKNHKKKSLQKNNSANKYLPSRDKILSKNQTTKRQRKSYSPIRDHKQYKSGPTDKKNYLSNNISSKTSRDVIMVSRSQKNLTDRIKNPLEALISKSIKERKKKSKQKLFTKNEPKKVNQKKSKNNSSIHHTKKHEQSKAQTMAKQFDALLKDSKVQKSLKSQTTKKKKKSNQKNKKKVIISNNNTLMNKNKVIQISDYSSDSHQSPDKIIGMKYLNKNHNTKVARRSLQPHLTNKKPHLSKIKTQEYSPEKFVSLNNNNKMQKAAILLQKNIRAYLDFNLLKKQIQFMTNLSVINNSFKSFLQHRNYCSKKKQPENIRRQLLNQNRLSIGDLFSVDNKQFHNNSDLVELLEDILNEEKVSSKIKEKISNFLLAEKSMICSSKNSARSSLQSHCELQIKSERRFLEQHHNQIDKSNKNSRLLCSPETKYFTKISPKIQKQQLSKSPQLMLENLATIKQFHREKLIANTHLQKQGIDSLALRNIFSPKTQTQKKQQLQQKLQEELQKFDKSIGQVIKCCKDNNEEQYLQVKPFSVEMVTPQHNKDQSPRMQAQSEKRFQDLSMQLLEYYEQKTQLRVQNQYQKLDCTFEFIDEYLLNLFQFIRQKGQKYLSEFVMTMKTSKNLEPQIILKNMHLVTQNQDDDDAFKLPMYKYLENEEKQLISADVTEEFNQQYSKLQRHYISSANSKNNLQQIYIKMVIECTNEALNNSRPIRYIFTETALTGLKIRKLMNVQNISQSSRKVEQDEALQIYESQYGHSSIIEQQFELYFASAMNEIYRWAHFQAGLKNSTNFEQETLIILNQRKFKELIIQETNKNWSSYDELFEAIVELGSNILQYLVIEFACEQYYSNLY